MRHRHSRHQEGQGTKTPHKRLGTALALLALSAHLVLPLFYTCRTYRSLTLSQVPACCAAKAGCTPATSGSGTPTLRTDGVTCPYCKAASPFRHANFSPMASAPEGSAPLWAVAVATPHSIPAFPPDLTSASPRAPPISC